MHVSRSLCICSHQPRRSSFEPARSIFSASFSTWFSMSTTRYTAFLSSGMSASGCAYHSVGPGVGFGVGMRVGGGVGPGVGYGVG